jgi:hypothetical protein
MHLEGVNPCVRKVPPILSEKCSRVIPVDLILKTFRDRGNKNISCTLVNRRSRCKIQHAGGQRRRLAWEADNDGGRHVTATHVKAAFKDACGADGLTMQIENHGLDSSDAELMYVIAAMNFRLS